MPSGMRPRQLRRRLLLAGFGAVLAGASLGTGVAHAGPAENYAALNADAICGVLDAYPTVAGVTRVLGVVIADSGFSAYQAGTTVAEAVIGFCPEHMPELQRFAAVYGADAQPVGKRAI